MAKCKRCDGKGGWWKVPPGFNPFYAGAMSTARVMEPVSCPDCRGTGKAPAKK